MCLNGIVSYEEVLAHELRSIHANASTSPERARGPWEDFQKSSSLQSGQIQTGQQKRDRSHSRQHPA